MGALGFCLITMAVSSQSLIQNSVDATKRARVISLSTGIAVGFPAVGALVIGLFSDFFGVQGPTLMAGLLCLIYSGWSVRRLLSQSSSLELNLK
jgi:MFS family permease